MEDIIKKGEEHAKTCPHINTLPQDVGDRLMNFLDTTRRVPCDSCKGGVDLYEIGQFLSSELTKQKEEMVERTEKMKKIIPNNVEVSMTGSQLELDKWMLYGYNQALQDITNRIKQ